MFFAFYRGQKQIVGRGGLLFFGLPRIIRAFVIVFGFVVALAFLPNPEGSPDAVAQSSGNPLNPRLGEGTGADPIAFDAAWPYYVPVYYYGLGTLLCFGGCIWITIPTSGNASPWPEVICCRELKII